MSDNKDALINYFQGKYDFVLKNIITKNSFNPTDRSVILISFMMLKAILAWDKDSGSVKILEKRWKVIESFIQ